MHLIFFPSCGMKDCEVPPVVRFVHLFVCYCVSIPQLSLSVTVLAYLSFLCLSVTVLAYLSFVCLLLC